jgi:hypothetical protein
MIREGRPIDRSVVADDTRDEVTRHLRYLEGTMIATPVQEVTSGKYGKTDLCGPSYGVLYTRMYVNRIWYLEST